jgi:type II secretory ATPase GspE/PulE/Tfp pilus assembly ATPase PilB-like protein
VCFVPAVLGESVTVRILDQSALAFDLDRIDYAPHDRQRLLKAISAPWGIVVITGPQGSGKTTVEYCCVKRLSRPEVKIMTAEDPVEYLLPWATQMQLSARDGVTFPRAMRAILRSDPDVIMLGEVRDGESLAVAQQAALTGHLVLFTLHAEDAPGALVRMVEMGADPSLVAESTALSMSQRLVRRLCPECSERVEPDPNRLAIAREWAETGGLDWSELPGEWRRAVGCEKCGRAGYRGRTVIAETLEVSHAVAEALRAGVSPDELRRIAVQQGMTTMRADGVRRAAQGQTTLSAIIHVMGGR